MCQLAGLAGLALGGLLLKDPASAATLPIVKSPLQTTFRRAGSILGAAMTFVSSVCILVALCGCVGSLCNIRHILVLVRTTRCP